MPSCWVPHGEVRSLLQLIATSQLTNQKKSQSGMVFVLCMHTHICTAGGMDYQSEIYSVTVEAEETSAEVSIAIFNASIVEGNETFTADLSIPVAEAALGVPVRATNGTAYVEIHDDGKQNPLHMHVIVCSPLVSSRLHPDLAYIAFSDMSYQVTEGSGYVTITLLVMV